MVGPAELAERPFGLREAAPATQGAGKAANRIICQIGKPPRDFAERLSKPSRIVRATPSTAIHETPKARLGQVTEVIDHIDRRLLPAFSDHRAEAVVVIQGIHCCRRTKHHWGRPMKSDNRLRGPQLTLLMRDLAPTDCHLRRTDFNKRPHQAVTQMRRMRSARKHTRRAIAICCVARCHLLISTGKRKS